jgi:hypothetical protein
LSRKLPPDPEKHERRTPGWAERALRHYLGITGTDYEDAAGDLLCDLMHWSDRYNFDFEAALFRARMHHEAETATDWNGDERGWRQLRMYRPAVTKTRSSVKCGGDDNLGKEGRTHEP